jgi:hypothetical protein
MSWPCGGTTSPSMWIATPSAALALRRPARRHPALAAGERHHGASKRRAIMQCVCDERQTASVDVRSIYVVVEQLRYQCARREYRTPQNALQYGMLRRRTAQPKTGRIRKSKSRRIGTSERDDAATSATTSATPRRTDFGAHGRPRRLTIDTHGRRMRRPFQWHRTPTARAAECTPGCKDDLTPASSALVTGAPAFVARRQRGAVFTARVPFWSPTACELW